MADLTGNLDELAKPSDRKLPKAERREQLLEVARSLIQQRGTAALTLGELAERAGVSKPIAYDHFGTKSGLLVALCQAYDVKQKAAQREALQKGGATLEATAQIYATSYVDCVGTMGPVQGAAFAALVGNEETAEFRQSLRDSYVQEYQRGFGRVVDVPEAVAPAIYAGFLGAAEALAQDAVSGRLTRDEAIAGLAAIFTSTLAGFRRLS